jgi:hypothetical protein
MGREAKVHVTCGSEAGQVKVLLESRELILRGAIRRRYPKAAIDNLAVHGETLTFACAGEQVQLDLGEKAAASWFEAIRKPPPSLAAKLGLDKGAKALLIGVCDDPVLSAALSDALVTADQTPDMIVTVIGAEQDLDQALSAHAQFARIALWAIYPKGKAAAFGDTAIRAMLRNRGFRDTKSCAVSDILTATRYNPL